MGAACTLSAAAPRRAARLDPRRDPSPRARSERLAHGFAWELEAGPGSPRSSTT